MHKISIIREKTVFLFLLEQALTNKMYTLMYTT